ncbi:MAG: hypothetical protein QME68_02575 [Elusimicrobiota bacterium]|nr:hypothetical protein [Elusimicrobiota bacterium]
MRLTVRRKTVEAIIKEHKLIEETKLNQAIEEAKKNGLPLQQIIINQKLVDKAKLVRVLSTEWDVKVIDLSAFDIDPDVGKILPKQSAKRYNAVPFAKEENNLYIAIEDPRNLFAIEDISLRTGFTVIPYLALPDDIKDAIDKIHGVPEEALALPEEEEAEKAQAVSATEFAEDAKELTAELLAGLDTSGELEIEKAAEHKLILCKLMHLHRK